MPCPFCGDINRVNDEAPKSSSRLAGSNAESAVPGTEVSDAVAAAKEEELVVVRPAMFRAHPFRFLIILAMLVVGLTLSIGGGFEISGWPPYLMWLGLPILLAGVVWYGLWWLSTHLWLKLRISNKRSIRHEGIVQRHTTEVLHNHVRSVDIEQSFMQRILNVGTIGIDSAGQDGIEIICKDMPDPYHVKQVIDKYRKM